QTDCDYAQNEQGQVERECEFEPLLVPHASRGKDGHQRAVCWSEQGAEPSTILVREHRDLTGEPEQVCQRNEHGQSEKGLNADTRYEEMEDGLYEHHSKRGQMNGKQSNGSKECVYDGIDNPALIQNDVDCPRKADQKRGVGHRSKSFDKCLCCS